MIPERITLITCNLWKTERWPARAPAVERLLRVFRPDLFCVQELQPETQAFIDRVLDSHARVHDPLPGWTNEGNIWWNAALFEREEHGAEDVGILEPERRLFWARLKRRASTRSLFVATAHLTTSKNREESETGQSPRVRQLKLITAALGRLVRRGEPAFFMGDMNDPSHPPRILAQGGFVSAFNALGIQCPPTFQCYPTAGINPGEPAASGAIDFITANTGARALAATVPQVYADGLAPSDHWPVQAVYELVS